MESSPIQRSQNRVLFELAKRDPAAAERELISLSWQEQLTLICETPVTHRAVLLELLPQPKEIISKLPEAELCHTAKAVGLYDAGWIIEHATPEQMVACIDLDAWKANSPDLAALTNWIQVLANVGEETLAATVQELDPEVVSLWLRSRIEVVLHEGDDDFTPPDGAQTLDDQFYFRAHDSKDDLSEITTLLRTIFQNDYWLYFRMMQSVKWELKSGSEEWALRWRNGRLQDLGFPPYEESLAIYAPIPQKERKTLTEENTPIVVGEWPLPIWLPNLPEAKDDSPSLLRAIASLPEQTKRASLYAIIALANRVAIADRLELGDAETIPLAINKSIHLASRGLDYLVAHNEPSHERILARTPLERLFRIGSNIERDERNSSAQPI